MMTKKNIARLFILSLYVGLSLFFSLFVMFVFLSWLQLDIGTTWTEWQKIIINLAFLSFKLSLLCIPIGFVLWFFYYRKI